MDYKISLPFFRKYFNTNFTLVSKYSELLNKRACSFTIFKFFYNPARTFLACSVIEFMKLFIPACLSGTTSAVNKKRAGRNIAI